MTLRATDLNLLVILDALLSEKHVTRAGDRIGLSQPAMSNALSRLRHLFKDELLVRTANGMEPTPRALELAEPVRQILKQTQRVLESGITFDPETSARRFSIRMSDVLGLLLLPAFLAETSGAAPSLHFDIVHLSPAATLDALEKDEIDLAVSMGLSHSGSIRALPLLTDRMVCVMRKDHPASRGAFNLSRFLSERHLKVSMSPADLRFVDDVLARRGLSRKVALNVPQWLLLPHILERSNLLAVMPERLALSLKRPPLAIRDLPFDAEPFEWTMYWHRRHDADAAMTWLRGRFADAARAMR